MATSNTLRAAALDPDLIGRVNALAATAGQSVTQAQMGQLVAFDGVADAYESAVIAAAKYAQEAPPAVGANLAAVTDAALMAALRGIGVLSAE